MVLENLARVYQERNVKEEQFFRIYDSYRPNFSNPPLTLKFYSRDQSIQEDYEGKYLEVFRRKYWDGPKQKYPRPVTTNQDYGWYAPSCKRDLRFYYPNVQSPFTKIVLDLRKLDRYEPKFTGAPFLLQ